MVAGSEPVGRVAAILPHWGRSETTEMAIRALIKSRRRPEATVIVNNHVDDRKELRSAVARLQLSAPFELEVVTPPHNLGYLGGAVSAIRRLEAIADQFDFYWILNNDARPRPDALAALVRFAQRPDVAIVSCVVLDNGEQQPPLVYRPWRGRFSPDARRDGGLLGLEGVSGASFLLTATFLSRIGHMPDHLFLFFEEVWLAWAARAASMRVIACHASVVDHESGTAVSRLDQSGSLREYLNTRARLALTVEWRPECLLTVVPLTVLRAVREAMHGRGSVALAVLTGLTDGALLRLPRIDSLGNVRLNTRRSLRTFWRQSSLSRLVAFVKRLGLLRRPEK
jgi:GT2 family glycosyltransferase